MAHAGQLIRLVSGDDLEALIEAFLDDCRLANLSPKTLTFYGTNLGRFRWWCEQTGAPLDPVVHRPVDIREFLRYVQTAEQRWASRGNAMSDQPVSDSTLHAYYRTLRVFYNWLVEQEYMEVSPLAKVRPPKVRREQPDPFTHEELQRISTVLRTSGDDPLALRDRAIVAVLLDVGLRASEVAGIRTEHLDVTSGRLWIDRGKGNKARETRLGAAARRPVRRYWLRYRRTLSDGAFFLANDGEPLTGQGIHFITTKVGRKAAVYPCNPHRFRHTAAIEAIRAGMGLLELQTILGHSSLDMVRRYAKIAETDLAAASRDHSPLDKLKLGL